MCVITAVLDVWNKLTFRLRGWYTLEYDSKLGQAIHALRMSRFRIQHWCFEHENRCIRKNRLHLCAISCSFKVIFYIINKMFFYFPSVKWRRLWLTTVTGPTVCHTHRSSQERTLCGFVSKPNMSRYFKLKCRDCKFEFGLFLLRGRDTKWDRDTKLTQDSSSHSVFFTVS